MTRASKAEIGVHSVSNPRQAAPMVVMSEVKNLIFVPNGKVCTLGAVYLSPPPASPLPDSNVFFRKARQRATISGSSPSSPGS